MEKRFLIVFLVLIYLFVGEVKTQTKTDLTAKTAKDNAAQIEDRKLQITKKPRASGLSCSENRAIVRLKVTFHSSSKVTNVEIVESSGCKSFEKNVLKAAQKIKFKPEVKNGEAITVVRTVEYHYQLYNERRPF